MFCNSVCVVQVDGTASANRPVTADTRTWGNSWAPANGLRPGQVSHAHL